MTAQPIPVEAARTEGGARGLAKPVFLTFLSGVGLGFLVGAGYALWGDYKEGAGAILFGGLAGGATLALPVIAYVVIDVQAWRAWEKSAIAILLLFLLSFCVPYVGGGGGPVLCLQLGAILVPSFMLKRAWTTFPVSLLGGFLFLFVWWRLGRVGFGPARLDELLGIYPFVIGVVSLTVTIGKASAEGIG